MSRALPASALKTAARVLGLRKKNPAGYPPAGVIRMTIELYRVKDAAEVAPKLDVVVDFGRAPDLRRIRDMDIATPDEIRGVGTLDATAGIAGVAVLDTQVGEAALPYGQTDVAGNGIRPTVTRDETAGPKLQLPPEESSLSWKFITPAMASEPYWADAPSRSTSTCRSAD